MSKINEQLDALLGSRVVYKSKSYQLQSWHIADGRVHILTDSTAIVLNKSEVADELENFEVSQLPAETTNGLVHQKADFKNLNSVEDVLLDTIKKVKEDPKYVNQAKAINQSVSQLVNIQKAKISMIKIQKQLQ